MKDKWNDSRKNGRRHNRFDVKLTDEELAVVKRKAEFAKNACGKISSGYGGQGRTQIFRPERNSCS